MDDHSFGLLNALISSRSNQFDGEHPPNGPARGKTLFVLVQEIVSWARVQQAKVIKDLPAADEAGRHAHGRQLFRCLQALDVAEGISSYAADVDRKDVQVGLLCLVDVLIADLLPSDTDPLVHLESARNYSTLSLGKHVSKLVGKSPAIANPIVFNLPAADPANILHAPILAHEVGHQVVNEQSLVETVIQLVDQQKLDTLLQRQLALSGSSDFRPWVDRLRSWVSELLCDAIAASLTGPSWLYAIAAFLPAPRPGELNSHPFAADRLALAISHLDARGWLSTMETTTPTVLAWLEDLTNSSSVSPDPEETFLRGAIDLLAPHISDVAHSKVGTPLDCSSYLTVAPQLIELMEAGIPPCQLLSGQVPTAWQIVLAGWQTALSRHGDDARGIGSAAEDRPFNAYLVKSVELTRVTELWMSA